MAKKELVTKVWIEEGCIVCDACETTAPDVFEVLEDTCIVRPAALKPDFTKPRSEDIVDAAEECPVDVIKFDVVEEEVGEEAAVEAAPESDKSEAPAATAKKAADDAQAPPTADKATAADEKAPAPAKKEKSPVEKPEPSVPKAEPVVSVAGQPDPAIQALLHAATSRGGNAGILRKSESAPPSEVDWKRKDPQALPPDARQARVLEEAKKTAKDPGTTRRSFVGNAALATGWVFFGVGTGVSVGPAFARFMMPNVLEEPDPRVRVGKMQRYAEMQPGAVIEDFKPKGIWMIRVEDRVAALSIICTHLGCIPNWLPNDRKFKCPCHGSGYRQNGINFEGPTPRPLERFRVFVEDGIVVVDKSKKYQYELGQWDMPGSYIEV